MNLRTDRQGRDKVKKDRGEGKERKGFIMMECSETFKCV